MFGASGNIFTLGLASDNGGEHLDPKVGEVFATTDSQAAGLYCCVISITACDLADSKALFDIQHRNSSDDEDALIENAIVAVQVDSTQQFEFAFSLKDKERITVVPYAAGFSGRVMVAINWQRTA